MNDNQTEDVGAPLIKTRFSGKAIAVTGGGTGMGLQIAKDLHIEGATVHILGRRRDVLENAKHEIASKSQRFFIHQCDISDYEHVRDVFGLIREVSGNLYGLVNNAAVNPSRNDIINTDYNDWIETLQVNLNGAFNCSKAAIEQMLDSGKGGSIVNISSVGGLNPFRTRTSYNSSKFGLIGLTQSIALDYAEKAIRVNAICPGYVRTELTEPLFKKMGENRYEQLVNAHAMRRLGEPKEISNAVLFMLSEDASFITGTALPVDGGYLLKG